jgi:AcrR family transcriptional regulator
LDLFSAKGYEATSLKEIAGRLGLRDSAIYGHFESKAAIRDELYRSFGPNAVRLEWAELDLAKALLDPKAFVKSRLAQLATRWMDPRERKFFRLLLMENLHRSGDTPLDIQSLLGKIRSDMTRVAAYLIQSGFFREVDREWLVGQFIAPIVALRIEVAFADAAPDLALVVAALERHVDNFFEVFARSR